MAASGGIRFDFLIDQNLTRLENRILRFTVKDEDGVDETSFVGWTFGWFLLFDLDDADGLTDLATAALVAKITGGGITDSVPDVDVALADVVGDWPPVAGPYGHELWRTDAGEERRLSYGDFVVVH